MIAHISAWIILCVGALTIPPTCSPQEARNRDWAKYYPLAKGNVWRYSVTGNSPNAGRKSTTWRVLNTSSDSNGEIFAVWSSPADADDSGMQLQYASDGVRELSDNFYVLKFPLRKGASWGPENRLRAFTVLNEGDSCKIGELSFSLCAVVQDDDHQAKLRTVTTYAFGVGPIQYRYFREIDREFEPHPTQVLNLASYSVKDSPAKH